MLSITLICAGRLKERFFEDAAAEYLKRLSSLCSISVREVPEARAPGACSEGDVARALALEGQRIRRQIPKGAYVAALCVEGAPLSSEELSRRITGLKTKGVSRMAFIVGGSRGLSPGIKAAADLRLSMSPMTFPHHLARVMLLEQLYRALSIEAGSDYHK